jgi:hypothetical protein
LLDRTRTIAVRLARRLLMPEDPEFLDDREDNVADLDDDNVVGQADDEEEFEDAEEDEDENDVDEE